MIALFIVLYQIIVHPRSVKTDVEGIKNVPNITMVFCSIVVMYWSGRMILTNQCVLLNVRRPLTDYPQLPRIQWALMYYVAHVVTILT